MIWPSLQTIIEQEWVNSFQITNQVNLKEIPSGVYIFTYHSVVDPQNCQSWEMHYDKALTTVKHFAEHLKFLTSVMSPLSLPEAANLFQQKKINKPYFVINFDDGYQNILTNADPLCTKYGVTPTIFVNGLFASQQQAYYRPLLYDLLARQNADAIAATLNRELQTNIFKADELLAQTKDHYSPGIQKTVMKIWNEYSQGQSIKNIHLDFDQLRQFRNRGWHIANHTYSHATLACLPFNAIKKEIVENERVLSEEGLDPIPWLGYPNGMAKHVNLSVKKWLDQNSHYHGLHANGGVNLVFDQIEWLRMSIGDLSLKEFKNVLARNIHISLKASEQLPLQVNSKMKLRYAKSHIVAKKNGSKKRIAFLIPCRADAYGKVMASTRLRVYDIIKSFKKSKSYQVELFNPKKKYDLYIFQKFFNADALKFLSQFKNYGAKALLDINVNYFEYRGTEKISKEQTQEIFTFAEKIDGFIAASAFLEKKIKTCFPEKDVSYIPENLMLKPVFPCKKHRPTNPIRLLYIGYAVKAVDILLIEDILEWLGDKYRLELIIISEKNPDIRIKGIKMRYYKYNQAQLAKLMLKGDIKIAPRDLNDSYNLGHTFTKIGYPMSIGVPVVASDLDSYRGSPALLCRTKKEWKDNLVQLIESSAQRQKLGDEGIRYCYDHFNLTKISDLYIELFNKTLE
ncbi:MAG: polysaccharide deacetylase family protein [Candidatus Omnitrophica bacterium]|nr:polysaccharide deacetylase family protein [Candidatus Omnitrophota bacterium]